MHCDSNLIRVIANQMPMLDRPPEEEEGEPSIE